jgi:hypothetical protein
MNPEVLQDLICLAPLSISENDQCPHGIAAGAQFQNMDLSNERHSHPKSINEFDSFWKLFNLTKDKS